MHYLHSMRLLWVLLFILSFPTYLLAQGERPTIEIKGSQAFSSKEIVTICGVDKVRIIDDNFIKVAKERIVQFYKNVGYPLVVVKVDENLSSKDRLIMEIEDNGKYFLRRIEITGNENTRDTIIRRAVLLNEGDPFSEISLHKTLKRIDRLGLFYPVNINNVELRFNKKYHIVDINIILFEKGNH